jgi:hemerythrin
MSVQARLSGVSFHLADLDEMFPKLVGRLEALQQAVLNHEEGPGVEDGFALVGLLSIQAFRREEEAMELCRDKSLAVHRSAHQKFLGNLSSARTRFRNEGPSVALAHDLRVECLEWLVDHHKVMNSGMGRVVREMVERSTRHHQAAEPGGDPAA